MYTSTRHLPTLLHVVSIVAAGADEDSVLRWASSGGGWRAMVADMAFANAFQQADLFDDQESAFSAISTTSGGSWFSTQFFYSPEFHQRTLSDPASLYDFVLEWMDSYLMYSSAIPSFPQCDEVANMTSNFIEFDGIVDYCNLLAAHGGSWADFIEGMLEAASQTYTDPAFVHKMADSQGRVASLQSTDLFVQMALAANSRSQRSAYDGSSGVVSYVQQAGADKQVYTVPIAVQHAVKSGEESFNYGVEQEHLPLQTAFADAAKSFRFRTWNGFNLFPGDGGDVLTTKRKSPETTPGGELVEPFSGKPTVTQLAAASSAAAAHMNGAAPSALAQAFSRQSYLISQSDQPLPKKTVEQQMLNQGVNEIYSNSLLDGLAVCSQWPGDCGATDGRLMDGAYIDGPSLAQNVGQYQTEGNGDLDKTLKLIVTNTNYITDRPSNFISYFHTPFNEDVAPGDFVWAPAVGAGGIGQATPWRSTQIFEEFLDEETFKASMIPIEGTNLSFSILAATTTDNPAFGVKKGQKAEILVLQTNSVVPTSIIGTSAIEKWTVPLADLSYEISTSNELVKIVRDFVRL